MWSYDEKTGTYSTMISDFGRGPITFPTEPGMVGGSPVRLEEWKKEIDAEGDILCWRCQTLNGKYVIFND